MYLKIKLLLGALATSELKQSLTELVAAQSLAELEFVHPDDPVVADDDTLFLSYLTDAELKGWLKRAKDQPQAVSLGILPNEECPAAIKSMAICKDLTQALEDALDFERRQLIDLLTCNQEPVFRHLTVGDVFGLNNTAEPTFWEKVKAFWVNLHQIHFDSYTLVTGKDQSIHTAATGILVLEHNNRSLGASRVNENLSYRDGKLNAFILAPKSLITYLYFMFVVFFVRRFSMEDVARTVGVVQTGSLLISSAGREFSYRLDGQNYSTDQIELMVYPLAVRFHLGRSIGEIEVDEHEEDENRNSKDTVRISALPQGELTSALLTKPVPFFPRASDEDIKDLFVSLRNGALFSESFIVLMVLSTILAATGLFMSSAPVIIGAMILAPLMAPIISLAMGVVRYEINLMQTALKTIFWGTAVSLLVAMVYAWMLPLSQVTPEIAARLNPNLLDLMVAIISGIAGAYASARSEIAKSLAGVAIAVALIPPLAVTGIGLGWGDWAIVIGSFLLFLTNLVGITLAAAFTFIVLGYSPVKRAKKGISYTLILMGLISIPLLVSFFDLVDKNNLMRQLQQVEWVNSDYRDIEVQVTDVETRFSNSVRVFVDITSREDVSTEALRNIQRAMQLETGREVELEISRRILLMPESEPKAAP